MIGKTNKDDSGEKNTITWNKTTLTQGLFFILFFLSIVYFLKNPFEADVLGLFSPGWNFNKSGKIITDINGHLT